MGIRCLGRLKRLVYPRIMKQLPITPDLQKLIDKAVEARRMFADLDQEVRLRQPKDAATWARYSGAFSNMNLAAMNAGKALLEAALKPDTKDGSKPQG
jgi:hypothetical protein